jgi:hypothetical protein
MFDHGSQTYKSDLELGELYRDDKTKLEGHLVAISFFEHACERGTIRYTNGQGDVKESTFDAPELTLVKTGAKATTKKTGGPDRPIAGRSSASR